MLAAGCGSDGKREQPVANQAAAGSAERDHGDGTHDEGAAPFDESKVQLTDLKTKKFAYEAFPQWSMANPSKACPLDLSELLVYMNDDSPDGAKDAWGQPLTMYCGQSLPPGASGFAVSSSGPNGKHESGAGDDIASWK